MSQLRQLVRTAKRLSKVWLVCPPSRQFDARTILEPLEKQIRAVRQVADQIEKAESLNLNLIVQ